MKITIFFNTLRCIKQSMIDKNVIHYMKMNK